MELSRTFLIYPNLSLLNSLNESGLPLLCCFTNIWSRIICYFVLFLTVCHLSRSFFYFTTLKHYRYAKCWGSRIFSFFVLYFTLNIGACKVNVYVILSALFIVGGLTGGISANRTIGTDAVAVSRISHCLVPLLYLLFHHDRTKSNSCSRTFNNRACCHATPV